MLVGLLLNWGIFIPSAVLAVFVWPGGIVARWAAAVITIGGLALMMLFWVLRGIW